MLCREQKRLIGFMATGAALVLLAWVGGSYMTVRNVKEPPYRVEKVADGYEIRRYEAYLVADAEPPADSKDPLADGFRMLFAYITGANSGSRKIEMTAPVLQENRSPEKIAMTAPVLKEKGEKPVVSFVLPQGMTFDTAPLPTGDGVTLRKVPARRVAVLKFSGYATGSRMEEKRQELQRLLERDGLKVKKFIEAYYDPPWTPPFMRRNEVIAEIGGDRK